MILKNKLENLSIPLKTGRNLLCSVITCPDPFTYGKTGNFELNLYISWEEIKKYGEEETIHRAKNKLYESWVEWLDKFKISHKNIFGNTLFVYTNNKEGNTLQIKVDVTCSTEGILMKSYTLFYLADNIKQGGINE